MHFGTFPLLTGTPDALRGELDKAGVNVNLVLMTPGETLGK
jgi:L-ascorbate metabolism protein UlaG (beta-lactamase superfamily)